MARLALSPWARSLPVELLLAFRFLREGRVQSSLVLAGVTAGVAVTVFLTQLINQLQGLIIDRVMGSQAHVVIQPAQEEVLRVPQETALATHIQPRLQRQRAVDQWQQVLDLALDIPGVLAAAPIVTGSALVSRGAVVQSVTVLGVQPEDYGRVVRMEGYMSVGRFALASDSVLIGRELAEDLGLKVGDKLRVSTGARAQVLTVTGLFDMGRREVNRRRIFIGLRMAQALLDLPGRVSAIDLSVADLFAADAVADPLRRQTGLRVESWMQTNAGLLNALSNQDVSNNLIRGFVVAIVALGISSVLVVTVVQKQREIGILRAMGAGRARIMRIFLFQGALMGVLGSALGVLSALMPARRAARMDPVEAIRA